MRFELARVLVRRGEIEEAREELRRLLRYHRDHAGGKALIVELAGR